MLKIWGRLTSSLSFDNKSLMISIFPFSTAWYNGVVWINNIIVFNVLKLTILNYLLKNKIK